MNTGVLHNGHFNGRAADDNLPRVMSKEDQKRAFRRARRHSIQVKILKVLMPLASAGILSLYALENGVPNISDEIPVSIEGIDLSSDGLKMINPRYTGGDDKVGRYTIEADHALQNIKQPHILDLYNISAMIEHPDKKWTKLTAAKGVYDTKTEKLVLDHDIAIDSNRGISARLQQADLDTRHQLVSTDKPVTMSMDGNRIEAGSMQLQIKEKQARFERDVQLRIVPKSGAGIGQAESGPQGGDKEPIEISARTLEIFDAEKYALFSDDIKARQGKYTLTSDKLRVDYQADFQKQDAAAQSGSVKAIEAIDNVVLTSQDNQRVTGERAKFDTEKKLVTMTGDVRFKQEGNELRGETLVIDMQSRHLRLDPATGSEGTGRKRRVSGIFQPRQSKDGGSQKQPVDAGNADGSAAGNGFASFRMADSKQPVSIEADSLEVIDAKRRALFHGNVVVRQDKFQIISKQMVVTYSGDMNPQTAASPTKGDRNNIETIEAAGKVAITTPDNQTATSEKAVFDVASNTATISGNVVLSQGGNVLHGDKVVIDLTTGRSRFDVVVPADGTGKRKRPRISGVFMPGQFKELAKTEKRESAPAEETGNAPAEEQPPLPAQRKDAVGGGN